MSVYDHEALAIAGPLVRRHEGLRLKPYRCTAGKLTIGYGRNLEDVGITQPEAELLLSNDLGAAHDDLAGFPWWGSLSPARKAALVDMRFCLGPGGFRQFRQMLAALERADWQSAADEILDSRFAEQTGRRAQTLAGMMRDG